MRDSAPRGPRRPGNAPGKRAAGSRLAPPKMRAYVEHYGQLLELSGQIAWMANAAGEVENDLPAWRAFTGQTFDQLRGLGWLDAVHPDDRDTARRLMANATPPGEHGAGLLRLWHADGRLRCVQMTAKPMFDAQGRVAACVAAGVDVTARWQAERIAASQTAILEMLVHDAPLNELGEQIVLAMETLLEDAVGCLLWVRNGCLYDGAAPHIPQPVRDATEGLAIGPAAGSCGTAAYRRQTVIVADIASDPLWEPYRDLALANGLRACWSMPIFGADATVVGTFAFYYRTPRRPTDDDLAVLRAATHLAALAYERDRARQERAAVLRAERLERAELEVVFDSLTEGLLVFDQRGDLVRVNATMHQMMAQPPEFYASDSLSRYTAMDPRYDDGRPLPYSAWPVTRIQHGETLSDDQRSDFTLLCGDGRRILVNAAGAPLRNDRGEQIGGVLVLRDITERHRLEAQVAAQAAQMRTIFETLVYGLIVIDARNVVIQANQAAVRLFGFDSVAALVGEAMDERIAVLQPRFPDGRPVPPELIPSTRVLAGEVLDGLGAPDLLYHFADGREALLSFAGAPLRDAGGNITGGVLIFRDVTERRRLEQEVTAQAEELRVIFDSLADGVIVLDTAGAIRHCNAAACLIMGYDYPLPAALRRLSARFEMLPFRTLNGAPLSRDQWVSPRILRGEVLSGPTALETRLQRPDGQEIIVNYSGAPLRDAGGVITGGLMILRDVTAARLTDQAREDFINIASHELRAPLTPLLLACHLLVRRAAQPDRYADIPRLSQEVVKHAHALDALADDMLDLARINAGHLALHPAACDLAALIAETVATFRQSTGRVVELAGADAPIPAQADAPRLRQVLQNLLMNAAKYSPSATTIVVVAERDGDRLTVRIRDQGVGIAPQHLPHLFQRYYRVPSDEQAASARIDGLGLGLYICRRIVEAHGGTIGVVSAPGLGSTFTVALPLGRP